MELDADEPGMARKFDRLRQVAVRRHSGEFQAPFQLVFRGNRCSLRSGAGGARRFLSSHKLRRSLSRHGFRSIGAKSHRAAEIALFGAVSN